MEIEASDCYMRFSNASGSIIRLRLREFNHLLPASVGSGHPASLRHGRQGHSRPLESGQRHRRESKYEGAYLVMRQMDSFFVRGRMLPVDHYYDQKRCRWAS